MNKTAASCELCEATGCDLTFMDDYLICDSCLAKWLVEVHKKTTEVRDSKKN